MCVYYDYEWGMLLYDDCVLFEFFCLEGVQVGFFWCIVLVKCECYCEVFYGFVIDCVVVMSDVEFDVLMLDVGIICNCFKILFVCDNVCVLQVVIVEYGSLDVWLWLFVDGVLICNVWIDKLQVFVIIVYLDCMSKILKKCGFCFVGSIICYVFMQVIGMVDDYMVDCFCYGVC